LDINNRSLNVVTVQPLTGGQVWISDFLRTNTTVSLPEIKLVLLAAENPNSRFNHCMTDNFCQINIEDKIVKVICRMVSIALEALKKISS
jgi:hypothetical protein